MAKITKRTADAAPPKTTSYFLFDDDVPCFGLRVMPSGKKSWLIQYRSGGRTRRVTFGRHGTMTAEEARKQAKEMLADVSRGGDPAEEKATQRRTLTLGALCDRFLNEHVALKCKPSTQGEYRRSVELFIKPRLGAFKVTDVKRSDIAALHGSFSHIPYQANRTLGVLSKVFNLAEVWGLRPDGSNPCRHVPKYAETKRERFLSPEEFAALGKALAETERKEPQAQSAVNAIRLLVLTGCRLGEIQTLKWEYVKPGFLALPDSKTGAKRVPIGKDASDVLAGIKRVSGNPYVIAGKVEGQYLTDLQQPWQRIRARAGLGDVRIHDLRHSFASGALHLGEGLPMIGKLLGHSQVQTTARYAHLAQGPATAAADRISADIAKSLGLTAHPERPEPPAPVPPATPVSFAAMPVFAPPANDEAPIRIEGVPAG